jgi:hypothetical protein
MQLSEHSRNPSGIADDGKLTIQEDISKPDSQKLWNIITAVMEEQWSYVAEYHYHKRWEGRGKNVMF